MHGRLCLIYFRFCGQSFGDCLPLRHRPFGDGSLLEIGQRISDTCLEKSLVCINNIRLHEQDFLAVETSLFQLRKFACFSFLEEKKTKNIFRTI